MRWSAGSRSDAIQSILQQARSASSTLQPEYIRRLGSDEASGGFSERVEAFERSAIQQELRRDGNHMTNHSEGLGLERSHPYKKCQQLGIAINRE